MTVAEIKANIISWVKTGIPFNVKSSNVRALLTWITNRIDVQEPGRIKIIKKSGNLSIDQEIGDRVTGVIEDILVINAIYIGGDISLLSSYFIINQNGSSNPREHVYEDITALLADQANQTPGFNQEVTDASLDPDVDSGRAYYVYTGGTTETLSDYIRLSDAEAQTIVNSQSYRIFDVKQNAEVVDDATAPGQILVQKNGSDEVTNIVFDAVFTQYLLGYKTQLDAGKELYIKLFNKTQLKLFIVKINAFDFTDITEVYYSLSIETTIASTDLAVADTVEVFVDMDVEGSGVGAVDSVFGRTGIVTAQPGDYDLYEIDSGGFAPSNYTPVGGTDAGAQFLGVDNKLGSLDNDIANQQSEIDDKVPTVGDATIYDVKTFDESPIVPTPTTDLQAANRRFVLDNLGLNIENYRVLYSQSAFPTTAGFTTFGSATLAASGGELVVGTSVNAEFTHGITFNNYLTDLENIRIKVRFRIASALSPTTYGFGVGSKSTNPAGEYSYHHQFSMSSSGASGNGNTIRISNNATWTSKYAGLSQNNLLAYSTNDVIEMIAERRKEKISIITKNLTTGNVITATYKYDIATEVLPNISKVAFYMFGGTYNVQFFEISTKEVLSPEWCFIGDSKTQGLLLPKLEDGFFYKFLKDYPKSVNLSGGSERTPAVISRLAEIIALAPEKVVLNIGSNDKRDSVPVGTWSANYDSLVSSLQSAGIEVYHLLQFNETSLDFTDYNNHITSTYPKNRCIRTGTLTLHVDGIHPDAAANEIIYNAVLNFVKNS